jgi:hypothetical protein
MKSILTLAMVLAASQAQALQCMIPDPVRSFQAAMNAPETYVVLRGRVAEAEILIPPERIEGQTFPVPGWFIGHVLTGDGFTQGLETPVTVRVTCYGAWCGSMLPEVELIMFAQVSDGAYTIEADGCETWVFAPDPLVEQLLTSCIRGEACVPAYGLD